MYPVPERQIGSCRAAAYERETLDHQAVCGCEGGGLVWGWPVEQSRRGDGAGFERFFAPYESIPFDDAAAAEYGRIRGHLAGAGTLIGPNDLMIAAIAPVPPINPGYSQHSRILGVPGLLIEDWELP